MLLCRYAVHTLLGLSIQTANNFTGQSVRLPAQGGRWHVLLLPLCCGRSIIILSSSSAIVVDVCTSRLGWRHLRVSGFHAAATHCRRHSHDYYDSCNNGCRKEQHGSGQPILAICAGSIHTGIICGHNPLDRCWSCCGGSRCRYSSCRVGCGSCTCWDCICCEREEEHPAAAESVAAGGEWRHAPDSRRNHAHQHESNHRLAEHSKQEAGSRLPHTRSTAVSSSSYLLFGTSLPAACGLLHTLCDFPSSSRRGSQPDVLFLCRDGLGLTDFDSSS